MIKNLQNSKNSKNSNSKFKFFKIEDSVFELKKIKIEKSEILSVGELVLFYQSHSMKNYYEKLKPFFEKQIINLVIKTPLPLQKYEHVFIPQEFENKTMSEQQS